MQEVLRKFELENDAGLNGELDLEADNDNDNDDDEQAEAEG